MSIKRTPVSEGQHSGGLELPRGVGISTDDLQSVVDQFSTLDKVEESLAQRGFHMGTQPSFGLPDITPEILATVDNREYTTLFAQQNAWSNWIGPNLARAENLLLQTKNTLKIVEAKQRLDLRRTNRLVDKAEKQSATEIDDEVETDPTRMELLLAVQRAQQEVNQLKAWQEIAERNLSLISRQVEIRRQEIEGGQRENNMPQRGTPRPITHR